MKKDMNIRPAKAEDYPEFLRLCEVVDQIHRENVPGTFRKPDGPSRSNEYFLRMIADPERLVFVADVEGSLAGFTNGSFLKSPDTPIHIPKNTFRIDNIVVDPSSRGSGIGYQLHEKLTTEVRRRGISEINLVLYSFNEAALRFYKKLGYAIESHWMTLSVS